MWASENGHTEIGKLLLKHKPKVNIQDSVSTLRLYVQFLAVCSQAIKEMWSALILASRRGDLEMVQGLLDHGAEIDMHTNVS